MSEKEIIESLVDKYVSFQLIKSAENKEKELDYQIQVLETRLTLLGVVDIDKFKR